MKLCELPKAMTPSRAEAAIQEKSIPRKRKASTRKLVRTQCAKKQGLTQYSEITERGKIDTTPPDEVIYQIPNWVKIRNQNYFHSI